MTADKRPVRSGLDVLQEQNFAPIAGARAGLLVNQASVNGSLEHAADIFGRQKNIRLAALFGPQHGIHGTTQDNMIEWEGFRDERLGVPAHSLYGRHRKPTDAMLKGIDTLVADLPDIGSRYYTFVWTAKLCMEACAGKGIRMVVLDRPNPIGGDIVEGPSLNPAFRSFVGLSPVAVRHGLTLGEMLTLINREEKIGCSLEVIRADGWQREMDFAATGLPWVLPSPNMPTPDTALVYPGGCLLEATNISEGRGTCRPFELLGAPFIDPYRLIDRLKGFCLPGLFFRPAWFQPTFHKHAGQNCAGVQVHVIEPHAFRPVWTYAVLIHSIKALYPASFQWKSPPYEYEHEKMPIDILWGDESLRQTVDAGKSLDAIREKIGREGEEFLSARGQYLLYP